MDAHRSASLRGIVRVLLATAIAFVALAGGPLQVAAE